MLFLRFSSNITPRIRLATASSLCLFVSRCDAPPLRRRPNSYALSIARLVAASRSAISRLVFLETLARHRHRDGDRVAERVAQRDAGRADAERVLLAVIGDAGAAHRRELREQRVEPREVFGVRAS